MNILLVEINPGLFILGDPPLIVLDEAYSFAFTAYGGAGPYRWALSGALPTGITWDASTATLSGTTSVPGTFPVVVTLKDAQRNTISKTINIVVQILPMQITNSFADYTAGVAQNFTYTSSGGAGTKTWAITGGTLPDGLGLDSSGHLTGNTTGLSVGSHTFTYTVTVTGSVAGVGELEESVTVSVVAISITNSAPDGRVGTVYSHTYTSSGGTGTKTWTNTGTLPTSLSLSSSGVLSGTPSVANTFTPTIIVTDNAGTQDSLPESIVIASALTPVTWSPTDKHPGIILTNSNLDAGRSGSFVSVRSTGSKSTGKSYFEIQKLSSGANTIVVGVGTSAASLGTWPGNSDPYGWGFQIDYPGGPYLYNNGGIGVPSSLSGQYCSATNDRAMFAIDHDAGLGWVGIKGVWDGNPSAGTGASFTFTPGTPLFIMGSTLNNPGIRIHSGQDAFSYTVPTGFDSGFLA